MSRDNNDAPFLFPPWLRPVFGESVRYRPWRRHMQGLDGLTNYLEELQQVGGAEAVVVGENEDGETTITFNIDPDREHELDALIQSLGDLVEEADVSSESEPENEEDIEIGEMLLELLSSSSED